MVPKSVIRQQVYHRHFMTTVEISFGPPLTDEQYLAFKRESCVVHKGEFCDCTLEDFERRNLQMFIEVMSKPPYLSFKVNHG